MHDYFLWNDRSSRDYGIRVMELPPITAPEERATFTDVPGRSGSLTTLEGDMVYDDLTLAATCYLSDPRMIPALCAWLKGSGKVVFPNHGEGFYYARIVNQIKFDKILRGNPNCSFSVNFRCKPFRYADPVLPVTIDSSPHVLYNPGTVFSEPIITVYGSGDITLVVGDTTVSLLSISTGITLDSVLQEAYFNGENRNDKMMGDFPVLQPGDNNISWEGSVSKITITPNWRYYV